MIPASGPHAHDAPSCSAQSSFCSAPIFRPLPRRRTKSLTRTGEPHPNPITQRASNNHRGRPALPNPLLHERPLLRRPHASMHLPLRHRRIPRDIFSCFFCGDRVSLAGGIVATLLALTLGLTIGATAGLRAHWLDELQMRTNELFLSLPWFYLLLASRAILPLQLSTTAAFWLVTVVIALSGCARAARLIRGMILSGLRDLNSTVPESGVSQSARHLARVDLPEPGSPEMTRRAPVV